MKRYTIGVDFGTLSARALLVDTQTGAEVATDTVEYPHGQIWKTQQWPQDWKTSVFIPIPKKGSAKECSNYCTIALISHASKVMLKILQARLQQYMNCELPNVQEDFRKGRGRQGGLWEKRLPLTACLCRPRGRPESRLRCRVIRAEWGDRYVCAGHA